VALSASRREPAACPSMMGRLRAPPGSGDRVNRAPRRDEKAPATRDQFESRPAAPRDRQLKAFKQGERPTPRGRSARR
jgi:hypothetical protein